MSHALPATLVSHPSGMLNVLPPRAVLHRSKSLQIGRLGQRTVNHTPDAVGSGPNSATFGCTCAKFGRSCAELGPSLLSAATENGPIHQVAKRRISMEKDRQRCSEVPSKMLKLRRTIRVPEFLKFAR